MCSDNGRALQIKDSIGGEVQFPWTAWVEGWDFVWREKRGNAAAVCPPRSRSADVEGWGCSTTQPKKDDGDFSEARIEGTQNAVLHSSRPGPGGRRATGTRRHGGSDGVGTHTPLGPSPPLASRSRAPARSALSAVAAAARCPVRSGTFGNFRRALAAIFSPLVCLAGCVARFL